MGLNLSNSPQIYMTTPHTKIDPFTLPLPLSPSLWCEFPIIPIFQAISFGTPNEPLHTHTLLPGSPEVLIPHFHAVFCPSNLRSVEQRQLCPRPAKPCGISKPPKTSSIHIKLTRAGTGGYLLLFVSVLSDYGCDSIQNPLFGIQNGTTPKAGPSVNTKGE